jgi:4-amino-4-deoxy-L-arabinose transferase-like glycosyltransferase
MLFNTLRHPKFLIALLLITLIAHLFPAIIAPLSVDEAHYALYGQHLALSYFDHPPLVGWLQAIALLLGEQEWQLRLFALLSYALTLILLHRYTLHTYHSLEKANLAALLFSSIPLMHLLGIGLVPDTLLMPLTIALFWQAQQTLKTPLWRNWILLGVLIGLGALSKYTTLLFAIGLIGMLIVSKSWHWFLSLKFWLAVTIAGIMSLPILIWNFQHDWISIHYQLDHGQPNTVWQWSRLLQSQAAQLLLYTPLIWFAAWTLTVSFKAVKDNHAHRQLVAFTLPALLMFTLSSGKEPSLPHWLAFFYLLWLPSLADYLLTKNQRWLTRATLLNIGYGWLITLLAIALMAIPSIGKSFTPNPVADLVGWKEAATIAQSLRQEDEAILTTHWVDSSRLAWYARPTPIIVLDDRFDQFDIWFDSPSKGLSGLLVLPPDSNDDSLEQFAQCHHLAISAENFRFYRCQGLIDTP